MQAPTPDTRVLSKLDHARLSRLIEGDLKIAATSPRLRLPIEAVLDVAELLPPREVPSDLVTMNSRVLLADVDTGGRRRLTICYPIDADSLMGRVSVLSPIGTGLLGLRQGAVARWRRPDGTESAADVVEVLFQPEAHGLYAR